MKRTTLLLITIFLFLNLGAQETTDSLQYLIQNFQFKKALQWIDSQEQTKVGEFQKAMCHKALGETPKAIQTLKALAEEYPTDISIQTELAQCYERQAQWNHSSDAYANLMALDTANVYFRIKKGEIELNRRNTNAAIKDLTAILQNDTLTNVVRLLGKSYETANNLDSAIQYYHLGWNLDATDAFSAGNLVNSYLKNKEPLKAYAYAQKYVESDTTNARMNFLYGYSSYSIEDYEQSRDILQKCYSAGDSSLVVTRALGMSYYFTGEEDVENAYKYLTEAYQQDTMNATILHHLAVVSNDVGKYDEAVTYFTKMLYKLIPSDMQLYLNYRGLAIAYEKAEKYYEAAQGYEKAFENADRNQRLDLAASLAHLYNVYLDRKDDALHYYRTYQSSIDGLRLELKHREGDHAKEIKELDVQLAEIDKVVNELADEINAKRSETTKDKKPNQSNAPSESIDPAFYIINGEIAKDFPSSAMESVCSIRTVLKLDRALAEDEPFVLLAKEAGKKILVFVDMDVPETAGDTTNEDVPIEDISAE